MLDFHPDPLIGGQVLRIVIDAVNETISFRPLVIGVNGFRRAGSSSAHGT